MSGSGTGTIPWPDSLAQTIVRCRRRPYCNLIPGVHSNRFLSDQNRMYILTSINHVLHLICFHIQSHVGHTLLVTIFKTDLRPSQHFRDVGDINMMHLDKEQRLKTEVKRSDQPPTLENRLRLSVANIPTKTIFMRLYDYIDVGDGCWRRNV